MTNIIDDNDTSWHALATEFSNAQMSVGFHVSGHVQREVRWEEYERLGHPAISKEGLLVHPDLPYLKIDTEGLNLVHQNLALLINNTNEQLAEHFHVLVTANEKVGNIQVKDFTYQMYPDVYLTNSQNAIFGPLEITKWERVNYWLVQFASGTTAPRYDFLDQGIHVVINSDQHYVYLLAYNWEEPNSELHAIKIPLDVFRTTARDATQRANLFLKYMRESDLKPFFSGGLISWANYPKTIPTVFSRRT